MQASSALPFATAAHYDSTTPSMIMSSTHALVAAENALALQQEQEQERSQTRRFSTTASSSGDAARKASKLRGCELVWGAPLRRHALRGDGQERNERSAFTAVRRRRSLERPRPLAPPLGAPANWMAHEGTASPVEEGRPEQVATSATTTTAAFVHRPVPVRLQELAHPVSLTVGDSSATTALRTDDENKFKFKKASAWRFVTSIEGSRASSSVPASATRALGKDVLQRTPLTVHGSPESAVNEVAFAPTVQGFPEFPSPSPTTCEAPRTAATPTATQSVSAANLAQQDHPRRLLQPQFAFRSRPPALRALGCHDAHDQDDASTTTGFPEEEDEDEDESFDLPPVPDSPLAPPHYALWDARQDQDDRATCETPPPRPGCPPPVPGECSSGRVKDDACAPAVLLPRHLRGSCNPALASWSGIGASATSTSSGLGTDTSSSTLMSRSSTSLSLVAIQDVVDEGACDGDGDCDWASESERRTPFLLRVALVRQRRMRVLARASALGDESVVGFGAVAGPQPHAEVVPAAAPDFAKERTRASSDSNSESNENEAGHYDDNDDNNDDDDVTLNDEEVAELARKTRAARAALGQADVRGGEPGSPHEFELEFVNGVDGWFCPVRDPHTLALDELDSARAWDDSGHFSPASVAASPKASAVQRASKRKYPTSFDSLARGGSKVRRLESGASTVTESRSASSCTEEDGEHWGSSWQQGTALFTFDQDSKAGPRTRMRNKRGVDQLWDDEVPVKLARRAE